MAKINIPFNDWSKDKLIRKIKTSTCRTHRMGKQNDRFTVGTTEYKIEAVLACRLWIVAEQFFEKEGCESIGEFVQIWEDIHPGIKYQPERKVYLHFFKEVEQVTRESMRTT